MQRDPLSPKNILIVHAAELITVSGRSAKRGSDMAEIGIIEDGALFAEKGSIKAVGKTSDVWAQVKDEGFDPENTLVLDATGRCVLPGFVDPHTHLVFAAYRADEFAARLAGAKYLDILAAGGGILSTVKATRSADRKTLIRETLLRLDTLLSFGVTTVEIKSGYGLDVETELRQLDVCAALSRKHPVRIVATFLGAHALPPEWSGRGDAYIDFLCETLLPKIADRGLARFCDVFCETGVFSVEQSRKLLRRAAALGLGIKIHADEMTPLGGAELAAELGAVSADHLLHASEQGIAAMAEAGVVAVLLPITAFGLREPYARARAMIDAGCAVALATDCNPGSAFSESIPLLIALAAVHLDLTPAEIVSALTLNAAAALGMAESIGSLDPGKQADILILQHPSHVFLPYHLGVNTVDTVIHSGRIVRKGQTPVASTWA